MENKNTVIALVLMGAVWLGFTFFFQEPKTQAPVDVQQTAQEQKSPAVSTPSVADDSAIQFKEESGQTTAEELITVETDFYRAVFTSSGARLKSIELKKYRVESDPASDPVVLQVKGSPKAATIRTSGSEHIQLPQDAPFQLVSGQKDNKLAAGEKLELLFRYQDATSGLAYDKLFLVNGDTYTFDVKVKVANQGEQTKSGTLIMSLVKAWDESMAASAYDFVGPVTLVGEDLEEDDVDDLTKESKNYKQPVWSAFETKYFIKAGIPLNGAADRVTIQRYGDLVINSFSSPYFDLASGSSKEFDYRFYYGPRDFEIIKQAGNQLDKAIDLGFFEPISSPLRHVLNFFYGYIGNYGVAIILLTVIIKMLFWPLTHKSYASMKQMKNLQPEMQKIREKYKKDRERMNQEMMALYKDKRVNPLGGCLPMVVQIPVFFALYKVLMVDIALRHAPFALWITDLSAKDPYYITPIIMGGTMFIQQKMTPSTMDPTQAKMFMAMPIVFTFLFLNFPSGLVLYWLVNNVLTIAQQYMIHRQPD